MAVTNAPRWRTIADEATTIYVDGDFGSDVNGNGTRARPYRTLEMAMFGKSSPSDDDIPNRLNIVCRGYIKSPGNSRDGGVGVSCGCHGGTVKKNCDIRGDYFGAAIFDGEGKNILCGQSLDNMIVINCPTPISGTTKMAYYDTTFNEYQVKETYSYWVGLGRAYGAAGVNYAALVLGLYSSSCLVHKAPLWRSIIGSSHSGTQPTDNSHIVYSKILPTAALKVKLGSFANCTVYKCRYGDRMLRESGDATATINRSLFGEFDMCVADARLTLNSCVFASDCVWYSDFNGSNPFRFEDFDQEEAAARVGVSVDKMTKQQFSQEYERQLREHFAGIANLTFETNLVNCLFSRQSSTELMNDPEKLDFTLTLDSDAYFNQGELWYAGAMNRAMRIRAIDGGGAASDAFDMCWDNQTVTGSVKINGGKVVYDTADGSKGSILSKVIKVDRAGVNTVRGLFNYFASHVMSHGLKLNTNNMFEVDGGGNAIRYDGTDGHKPDNETKEDLYMAVGGQMYAQKNASEVDTTADETCIVSQGYTVWLSKIDAIKPKDSGAYFAKVVNMDLPDVVYVRANETVYAVTETNGRGSLTAGNVYFNDTDGDILTTNGRRTICKGGSFVAKDSDTEFTRAAGNNGGSVLKIFDKDNDKDKWAPANMMSDYWVYKDSSNLMKKDGEILSSGNPDSYIADNVKGGAQTYLAQKYLQFKIEASKMYLDPNNASTNE